MGKERCCYNGGEGKVLQNDATASCLFFAGTIQFFCWKHVQILLETISILLRPYHFFCWNHIIFFAGTMYNFCWKHVNFSGNYIGVAETMSFFAGTISLFCWNHVFFAGNDINFC